MKVKSEIEVARGARLFATPWTAAYLGSSVHGIIQARVYIYFFLFNGYHTFHWNLPIRSDGKESGNNAGDLGSISGLGRSPVEGNSNPLFLPGNYRG